MASLVISFLLTLLILPSLSITFDTPYPYWKPKQKRTCTTQSPDYDLLTQHAFLHANEHLESPLWNSSTVENHISTHLPLPLTRRSLDLSSHHNPYRLPKRQTIPPIYTIDTYFHIVADSANSMPGASGYVTDQMISDQLAYLTNAYMGAGVAFNLIETTRSVNDTWAANGDDLSMKTALRRGTYSTLNVYYQTLLQSNGDDGNEAGDFLLGFCTMPTTITPSTPPSAYVKDGCNMLAGTLPGGTEPDYNLGGTSAHEIGHWNGLLHPFEDTDLTCNPASYGDYVADTPQEGAPTTGCPVGKDTCPDAGVPEGIYNGDPSTPNPYGPAGFSGPDPIHNIMDYSQDSCYTGFTAGQGARMVNLWSIYRMGL